MTYSVVLHVTARGRSCFAREVYRTTNLLAAKAVALKTEFLEGGSGRVIEVEVLDTDKALAWLDSYTNWLGEKRTH